MADVHRKNGLGRPTGLGVITPRRRAMQVLAFIDLFAENPKRADGDRRRE